MLARAPTPDDTGFLQTLWDDVETWLWSQSRPYVPESQAKKRRRLESAQEGPDPGGLWLLVEADGEPVGVAGLWQLDLHNRRAQVALTLKPEARGLGYGKDTLTVLCEYGFGLRGLHRLQAETLDTNLAMRHVAESVGFTREGLLRRQDWHPTGWRDVVVYGMLADEWAGHHPAERF